MTNNTNAVSVANNSSQEERKEQAMEQVAELLVKAFPGTKEVLEWIDNTSLLYIEPSWDVDILEVTSATAEITGAIAATLGWNLVEAKTHDDKMNAALEFIDRVKMYFDFRKKDYVKTINALDKKYEELDLDLPMAATRSIIYQFDALKEIGKLIKESAA